MPNPLQNIMDKIPLPPKARYLVARACQEVIGLAQDYWKDGHWEKPSFEDDLLDIDDATLHAGSGFRSASGTETGGTQGSAAQEDGLWKALPGEISEKMWGNLCVTPGDAYITERLIRPLGINKDMSILDLSAGLGGRLQKTSDEFGSYISGLEPDPDIAARGMAMSKSSGHGKHVTIAHYDPMTLSSARSFDCIISRETIYRVPDQAQFIKLIADCCKKKAQISFTDYIVDPEMRENPGIVAWMAFEKGAHPPSLVEMAEMWAKQGFTLRVHDDQTDYYKKEVLLGLARFAKFMATAPKPAPETKKAINKRLATWVHRLEALQGGMKFYRFYGLR